MQKRARKRAASVLTEVVRAFGSAGYRQARRRDPLEAHLVADRKPPLRLVMRPTGGRVFGGTFALEIATNEPLFPRTRGISARGRGMVRLRGFVFRARGDDETGRRLAERLGSDDRLAGALADVHFEQVRVDPDGRPVIRHMGGSLVWMLFPPMTKPIPIVQEQIAATVSALEAFSGAQRTRGREGPP